MSCKGIQSECVCVCREGGRLRGEGGRKVCVCLGAKFQCAETTQSNSCRKRWGPAGRLLTSRLVQARSSLLESGKAEHMCEEFKPESEFIATWGWSSSAKISSPPSPSDGDGVPGGEEHVQIPPSSLLYSGEDSRKAAGFIIEITNSVVSYIKVTDVVTWWEPRNLALRLHMDS